MKKKVLAALLAGAMVVSLAACGNSGGGSKDGDSGSDSSSSMVVSWWGNQTRNDRTTEVINMYLEDHPGLSIDGQFSEWDDYWNKLATSSAGNALPDVMQMDYMYLDQYVDNGLLLDLTPYIEDGTLDMSNVPENIQESQKVDGKTYAISLGTNANAMFYNKTALDEAGITVKDNMTLDEFVDLCKEVKEKTGLRTNLGYSVESLPEFWCRADDIVLYGDGKLGVDSPDQLQTIFDLEKQGIEEGWHLDPSVFTEITLKSTEQDPLVYGTDPDRMSWCAFSTSNQLTAVQNAAPEGMEIGITTWPSPDPAKSNYLKPSQLFSVSANCEDPDAAVEFINWFINDEACNKVLLGERGVPISTAISDAIASELSETDQAVVAYINDVVTPNSSPINPPAPAGANEFYDILTNLEEQVLYGQLEPADAAQQLFDQGNAALASAQ
ncbi:hypothetical protein B5F07_01715 [Lachnoclostridium sp. An169]|uniref:ABC transporter substrate-binding protein n=1 Tax=Lachnoclostridium sp. An169 TaxID=1965569 RepID=UPI000B3946E7|nr:extracellular solute-binding protein [Lachnoclostridium sp. An169]OUP86048.1 hypothetical protein B5F07_01715 [Lachnoclostridium sp. An169]HJA66166.1 extracellular solute-binding protein [Candidatus Mediterraneibacter cottocaccae]